MENQIEILESSDLSNEEINGILAEFGEETNRTPIIGDENSSSEESRSSSIENSFEGAYENFIEAIDQIVETEAELNNSEEENKEPTPQSEIEPIIPVNSPTILIDESSSRFSSAIWYNAVKSKSIILAGIGGIGSYVALLLSRMKPASITMYDPDIVERVNMSGQLYSNMDIGKNKVDSIAKMMADYSNFFGTLSIADKFYVDSPAGDIMICGFDNMKARKLFFESWCKHLSALSKKERKKCLFIDGRLAAEEFQVFCITGDDSYHKIIYLEEYLFSDEKADETICSYKQTSHCANMIGSIMVNLFVNFVANECNPLIPRDVPFLTTYDAERMFFKTSI